MRPVGNTFLRDQFSPQTELWHESYLATGLGREEAQRTGAVRRSRRTFQFSYDPGAHPLDHLIFALKYEPPQFDLWRTAFLRLDAAEVAAFVSGAPASAYNRRIGFYYEFLTGLRLPVRDGAMIGNYVPLLNPQAYLTAPIVKNPRWRVDDNLLGTREFSPLIQLTPEVNSALAAPWHQRVESVLADQPPDLRLRAITYLFLKETRSSFLIEGESPGPVRTSRFVAFLRNAGKGTAAEALSEESLTEAQRAILDPRYAGAGFRTDQNFVGEREPGGREIVHYISPPPQSVHMLMLGLATAATRMENLPPLAQATAVAFPFVFIHPFEDGNGRLHRFLLHDTLVRRGVLPHGTALPVSAAILADMPAYDDVLEAFSGPLMARAKYRLGFDGRITVENADELDALWRYPNLTPHVEYVARVMNQAIADLPKEIDWLRRHDLAMSAIRAIVDIPDRRLHSLMSWLEEGQGRLSKNKRKQFSELNDEEVTRIEAAYVDAYADE